MIERYVKLSIITVAKIKKAESYDKMLRVFGLLR
jgi:hypothetical protein